MPADGNYAPSGPHSATSPDFMASAAIDGGLAAQRKLATSSMNGSIQSHAALLVDGWLKHLAALYFIRDN